jgi:hypothetical protein
MEGGSHVQFKTHDFEEEWQTGILIRYDEFLGIGEIMKNDVIFYAPRRLIKTNDWL